MLSSDIGTAMRAGFAAGGVRVRAVDGSKNAKTAQSINAKSTFVDFRARDRSL
jgi:hypothetical protein